MYYHVYLILGILTLIGAMTYAADSGPESHAYYSFHLQAGFALIIVSAVFDSVGRTLMFTVPFEKSVDL